MERSEIAILIPALNEAKTIFSVVKKIEKFGIPFVIDDGSIDKTYSLAKKARANLIKHKKNLGYDQSLNSGFNIASMKGFKYIITFDADDQHDSKIISNFLDSLKNGSKVVCGIRNRKQRFAENIFSLYTNFRWGIKDPLCGMKGYSIDLYKELGHFDSYKSIGTELLLFALDQKYNFDQIHITVNERKDCSRFGSSLKVNLKIIFSLLKHIIKIFS
tara:strand:- start:274 stop:924 length:651 start_codon:yes stop_codon:yes gene_type:complete